MAWWHVGKPKAKDPAEEKYGAEAFALTCLALELAKADDHFDESEHARLRDDLAHHFDLSADEVAELMTAGEAYQAQSVETYGLTRTLREGLSQEERIVVIETLWRLAYADGVLDAEEFAFMRTIPAALGVENHLSEAAKRRALDALGLSERLS